MHASLHKLLETTLLVLVATFLVTDRVVAEGSMGSKLVQQLIASESLSKSQLVADTLSEHMLTDEDVQSLINAAETSTSDPHRNVLWHALRYSRSRLGRDYLLKTLPAADVPLRIEFLQSLQNPAPFDVPVLVAIYESAEAEAATDEVLLREFFLRLALGRWYETMTTDWHSTEDPQLYHDVGNRRGADADAAQLRVITYLVTKGHTLDARLAAFEYKGHNWFQGIEGANRVRLAEQLLASAETPAERARLVSPLRHELPPSRYLRKKEPPEVKLAAVAAIADVVEDAWPGTAGYTYLRAAYHDLLPLVQDEQQPELSRAAAAMIKVLETRYGEKAVGN